VTHALVQVLDHQGQFGEHVGKSSGRPRSVGPEIVARIPRQSSEHHPGMSHGVRCRPTMFTKQVSRRVDSPDPHRGRGGAGGRANSNKDLVTGPIRGFCALQVPLLGFHDDPLERLKGAFIPIGGLTSEFPPRLV
jgi:hypothetical protein